MARTSKLAFALLLLCCVSAHAQSWSSVLSSSRAIDWTGAGLPATLPDSETTANPWTPPVRSQCGSTIAAGTSESTIQTDLNACTNGTYLLLGPGSFAFTSAGVLLGCNTTASVTLRGSGGNSTIVTLGNSAVLAMGCANGAGQGTWSAGYSQGATSLTMSSPSGVTLTAGNIVFLNQCNTGLSGSSCATGTQTDNGGVFVCASPSAACAQQTVENNQAAQGQYVLVTGVTGSGPYTVSFTPSLYMPNWASGNTPTLSWQTSSYNAVGDGIEDMTIVTCISSSAPGCSAASTASNPSAVYCQHCYASWMKGVRLVGQGANDVLYYQYGKNNLLANSFTFADQALNGNDGGCLGFGKDSDDLFINNISEACFFAEGTGAQVGDVLAYNYAINGNQTYLQSSSFQHQGGSSFILHEGNDMGVIEDDDTWGTHNFNTNFRNHARCWDPPYTTIGAPRDFLEDSFARFANLIGNAADGGNGTCTVYESTVASPLSQTYEFGFYVNTAPSDTLTQTSAMLWGNCDVVNATCRFVSGEVPTSLSGNAAPYVNSVPGSHTLPCSFFLAGYTSTSCSAHTNGGTGLSWWKVCTGWATFPTSCSGSTLQPFPANGPDVSGGPYVDGNSYDNPAAVAWSKLPVDPTYQVAYTIASSSWSGGVETLSVASIPNLHHLMGKFQINGGNCGTSGAGTSTGAELSITASSGAGPFTVKYALASDPGICTAGTFLFPDIREFDERVYQNDPLTNIPAPTATMFVESREPMTWQPATTPSPQTRSSARTRW